MIKETIQYQDFNKKNRTEVLYFNINQSELMDNMYLRDDLEKIQASLEGPERELEPHEIQRILDLVKKVTKLAYGIRSEDGLNFDKDEPGENIIWRKFKTSKAYDAFIMGLFKNPEKAFEFLVACMPEELMEQARREMGENVVELPQPAGNVFENQPAEQSDAAVEAIVPAEVDAALDDWSDYNEEQLLSMPQDQFERLYNKIKGPKPPVLVAIAMKRRVQG